MHKLFFNFQYLEYNSEHPLGINYILSTCHEFTWTYMLLKLFLPEKQLQKTFIELHLLKFNFPQPLVKHEFFVESKPRKLEDDGKHAG